MIALEVSDCVEWIISDTEDQNHNLKVIIPSMVTNACNIEIKNMRRSHHIHFDKSRWINNIF